LIESVASGVPRLDYFTSGGTAGCPALLVEPSAANGILNSQDTTTNWVLGASLSGTYENVIGVSGNNLTVAVSGSGIGSDAGVLRRTANNVALASGSTYTISFFLKKTGAHTIGGYYAVITGGASGDLGGGFDVSGSFSSGQIFTYTGATNRIRRVEQWGTDVYRCSETFTMTASGTLTQLGLGPTTAVNNAAHPAVGLGIAFAAPQIELGAVPTTFIPTTTAEVTRNADVVTLSGAVSGCIGQTEGTIYAELDFRTFPQDGSPVVGIVTLNVGANNLQNCIVLGVERQSAGTNRFYSLVQVSNATQAALIGSTLTNGIYKVALTYKQNDFALYVNGASVDTEGSGNVPTCSEVLIGSRFNTDTIFLNDRIRSAALYTTRLTNAELAALTTL
jgi:hypothetical protein